jgi:phosphodiesterase/alkaline phosphatase D-like protein
MLPGIESRLPSGSIDFQIVLNPGGRVVQVLRVPRGLAVGIILFIVLVSGAEVWAQAPTATTGSATGISASGATLNGAVNANGNSTTVTFEYGTTVAYGTTVTADQSPVTGSSDTAVSVALTGLAINTTFHYRVVATNSGGTTYGADMTFTTLPQLPSVTTQAVSGITTTTAVGNANITDLGNPNPTAHGVVWNTGGNPTTADSFTDEGAAASTGAFTSNITGLSPNTTYYVRAYATNTAGTAYGNQVSFTTDASAPTATTGAATAVGSTGATLNGTVNANGDSTTVTFEYGTTVAYGTTVTADQSPVTGSSDTAVSVALTGLTSNTVYHYRVVGQNSSGTTYGEDTTFATLILEQIPVLSREGAAVLIGLLALAGVLAVRRL